MNYNFNQSPIEAENGLRKYMTSVFNKMFLALCLTGIVSYICTMNEQLLAVLSRGVGVILTIATFGIVIYITARIHKIATDTANALFWIYSALTGASLSPLFFVYTGESIASAFFTTAIFFGSMSAYGYITKKDLSGVGSFMTVGLISIIIASLVNIFLKSSLVQMGLSVLSIIVFCGLTAYDIQKIKSFYNPSDDADVNAKRGVIGALSLYLDFLNIFLSLLRLLDNRK